LFDGYYLKVSPGNFDGKRIIYSLSLILQRKVASEKLKLSDLFLAV
jgi:hypothetical protein